jgi:LAS superfamily LD-carboxypeptidase LdcB
MSHDLVRARSRSAATSTGSRLREPTRPAAPAASPAAVAALPATLSLVAGSGDTHATSPLPVFDVDAVLELQRSAGNAATTRLIARRGDVAAVQRDDPKPVTPAKPAGGWTGADTRGEGWNTGERVLGKMRRIPVEGLALGKQTEKNAANKALTDEEAAGRAIVVAPTTLDPTLPVDVMVQLHGYTETAKRPFAGWRQHKVTGEVRDVALDRVEVQMESLNQAQMVGILAQGGVQSQFGEGDDAYSLDPVAYARDVLEKAVKARAWKVAPPLGRTILAAHSGGGHTVRHALGGELDRKKRAKGPSAFAEVVLFDAITGPNEYTMAKDWVLARLNADLAVLTDKGRPDADKATYLKTSTRFRGYYATYATAYRNLDNEICSWFRTHAVELDAFGEELWTHYQVIDSGVSHEEVMRGSRKGDKKTPAAKGNIADALRALDNPTARKSMAAACGIKPRPAAGTKAGAGRKAEGGPGAGGSSDVAVAGLRGGAGGAAGAAGAAGTAKGTPTATQTPVVDKAAAATGTPAATIASWLLEVVGGFGGERMVVGQIARAGFTDSVDLSDLVFAARHPELGGGRIPEGDVELADEWRVIRHTIVEPAIAEAAPKITGGDAGVGAATETDEATGPGESGESVPVPAGATAVADPTPASKPTGNDFITNLTSTTLELLSEADRAKFSSVAWVDLDYPGAKLKVKDTSEENLANWRSNPDYVLFETKKGWFIRGAKQDLAQQLLDALARVRPGGGERRANSTATAILTQKQFKTDPAAYDAFIESQLEMVPGDDDRMNKHASAKFVEMREAAKKDGVALKIGNAFRERKVAEANAAKRDNAKAVAKYSSHSLGLAMDLSLRTKAMGKRKTVSTAMTNVVDLLRAPAYKWMFMRGAEFGFYQFRMEPWHWEYNPKGFADTFWADMPTLRPEEEPPKPRKKGR